MMIYKATNLIDGCHYIGATTKTIEERKQDHCTKAQNNSELPLHTAIRTYGPEAFQWESIDTASTSDELAYKEKQYVIRYNSKDEGYNQDCGGGFKKTIYQFSSRGCCIGEWTALAWAALSVLGKKKGISNACLGYNKTYKGYYWSYYKNYIPVRDSRKKLVYQYDLNGNCIAIHKSVSDASRNSGLSKTSISRVCRGERSKAGGYIWKYVL
ncbi:endonuclease [Flagellimonas algicola]|nr:endonuclease [Allomuricauda algicola]